MLALASAVFDFDDGCKAEEADCLPSLSSLFIVPAVAKGDSVAIIELDGEGGRGLLVTTMLYAC